MVRTISIPDNLGDLLANPQRIRDAISLLNGLLEMEVRLVPPGGVAPLQSGYKQIIGDPPALVLPLPLKFRRPIADSTATAASASAQLNILLAELRANSQNPSS